MKTARIHLIMILLAAVVTLPSGESSAQTNYSFSSYLIRDDNSFKSRTEYSELIHTASLSIMRTFSAAGATLQTYYGADLSSFNRYSDQQNYSHLFGIIGRYHSGNFNTDFGISYRLRRNDAQYIYYNTNSFSLFTIMNFEPDLQKIYSFGINYSRGQFKEFEDLNNVTYRLFGKFQRFFQNRSSISGELGLGVKNYVNQTVLNYFGNQGTFMIMPRFKEEPVDVVQLSVSANMGKSLTDNTGINITSGATRFVGEAIEAFSNGVYYYTENDLYDDPYSYEDGYATLNLTRQFGVGFQGKIGAEYHDKDYAGTPALTLEGELAGVNRKDTRVEYYFNISKNFPTAWSFPGSINVFFRFLMRQNTSNDPYFDFDDHLGILGFTLSK
ncbi:hypothetical protein ACFL6I_01195 [candidate division KSB1 bacterium]